ncbi:unnamed protein product [Thelazia callipaeda]|uniref:MFS domain-containing protein n=1 Tax=Thelazia callipaeda TaxID=103827 RepID=A0A0N5CUN8_THECL|nr:unnamed protein product [Thelazia callipaeda]
MHNNEKDCTLKKVSLAHNNSKLPESNASSMSPPDGGYGWVIVFASFIANIVVDGIIFSAGQTLVEIWEKDFQTTAMQASITQSFLASFYMLAGPLASALATSFGCRLVTVAGALMTFVGFILSSFAPSLQVLYFTFGIIGGTGFGLVYLPSILIVNQYFQKRRAFAVGIAVCGSGIGTILFSQIIPFLLKFSNNNWRYLIIYVAFITLISGVSGLCYRKVSSVTSEYEKAERTSLIILETKSYPETEGKKETLEFVASMIDTCLLSDMRFILIAVTAFLTVCCLFVPFIFLGKQANTVGANQSQQSYLISVMGLVNVFGRILSGLLSDLPTVDTLFLHNVSIITAGIATCLVPLLTKYWMYVMYTIPFAWGVACFATLRSVICIELLGIKKFSSAFGMMMLCMGIAALIGPPFAAFLKDMSGNLNLSFYVMGSLLTLSGVLCIPLRMVKPKITNSLKLCNTGQLKLQSMHGTERF